MTSEPESVDCAIKDDIYFSQKFPGRAAAACLFGYAIYLKVGEEGIRQGVTDKRGAFQWLNGDPLDSIKYFKLKNG